MTTGCSAAEGRAFLRWGAQDEDNEHREGYEWAGKDVLRAREDLEETVSQDLKGVRAQPGTV